MSEDLSDQLARVSQMAQGNPKWDLSPNDCAALTALLDSIVELTVQPDTRGLGTDEITVQRRRQIDGPDLWAVCLRGYVLNKKGKWEYEPIPSSRTDAFLKRCRFNGLLEAVRAAERAEP